MKKIIDLLIIMGIHIWKYSGSAIAPENGDTRQCKLCSIKQIFSEDTADESGWPTPGKWTPITN